VSSFVDPLSIRISSKSSHPQSCRDTWTQHPTYGVARVKQSAVFHHHVKRISGREMIDFAGELDVLIRSDPPSDTHPDSAAGGFNPIQIN
jgi:hypothetical protein